MISGLILEIIHGIGFETDTKCAKGMNVLNPLSIMQRLCDISTRDHLLSKRVNV